MERKRGDNGDFCSVFWWGGVKKFGLIYFDFQWIEKFFKEKCKNNLVCWEKSSIFATSNQENESCLTSCKSRCNSVGRVADL